MDSVLRADPQALPYAGPHSGRRSPGSQPVLPRVGYIRTPESVGWDLHYAHHVALPDGGEQIVIATDRPIGFREASRQPRSIDYPFTVIEMHVNGDGEGQGTMSVATKVIADKDKQTITLENFATSPVLLESVKRQLESQ